MLVISIFVVGDIITHISFSGAMMGNPHEASGGPSDRSGGGGGGGDGRGQKATFSGMTVLVGVVAFILDVVSVAVPQWGNYYPAGITYVSSGKK